MTPLLASSLALRARLDALENLNFDTKEICRRVEIDESTLADPQHFVPESTIWAVWREAVALSGDTALGLHAGATVPFGTYGVLNYLSMTAKTLGEGFELLVRYSRLLATGNHFEIVSAPGGPHALRFIPFSPVAGAGLHCRDYALAVMTKHLFERQGLRPVAVEFCGPPVAPVSEYAEVLGTFSSFGHEHTAMVFSDLEWNAELPASDALLTRTLEDYAANLIARLPRNHEVGARAAREIARRLCDGNLGLRAIARSLGLSERSLQRHLSQEGYTFEGLVDAIRRESATDLLKDPSLSIGEIAYLLGYSGAAAFHRAFKRWTGSSPRRATRDDQ